MAGFRIEFTKNNNEKDKIVFTTLSEFLAFKKTIHNNVRDIYGFYINGQLICYCDTFDKEPFLKIVQNTVKALDDTLEQA